MTKELLDKNHDIFFKYIDLVFDAVRKANNLSSQEIIDEIKSAGLRGRGGAGFPTGLKWELVSKEGAEPKYVICNAHEGEPETYKDKYILENFPHLVIGGMLIAAAALNSKELFITVKETYKKAISLLKNEINYFEKHGFLKDIKINVFPAELGYAGGEESALLNELEGKRVEPRIKPPFVSTVGLFGKPSLINNVESFANIPFIINYGSKKYREFGTEDSSGQKVITVVGDVKNPGVIEIEFGKNLNDFMNLAGGPNGKIKFALTGGFAGTVITPKQFNIPFEFVSSKMGLSVGAGTIFFYNEKTNLLETMKQWLEFFKDQSCGQCVPCREGTFRLYEIISNTKNKLSKNELTKMEEIFFALDNSSLCALGSSVSLATRSLITVFKKELVNA